MVANRPYARLNHPSGKTRREPGKGGREDQEAGADKERRGVDVDDGPVTASESGVPTTYPSIRKLIVRPRRWGSVRNCVHVMIDTFV